MGTESHDDLLPLACYLAVFNNTNASVSLLETLNA